MAKAILELNNQKIPRISIYENPELLKEVEERCMKD